MKKPLYRARVRVRVRVREQKVILFLFCFRFVLLLLLICFVLVDLAAVGIRSYAVVDLVYGRRFGSKGEENVI